MPIWRDLLVIAIAIGCASLLPNEMLGMAPDDHQSGNIIKTTEVQNDSYHLSGQRGVTSEAAFHCGVILLLICVLSRMCHDAFLPGLSDRTRFFLFKAVPCVPFLCIWIGARSYNSLRATAYRIKALSLLTIFFEKQMSESSYYRLVPHVLFKINVVELILMVAATYKDPAHRTFRVDSTLVTLLGVGLCTTPYASLQRGWKTMHMHVYNFWCLAFFCYIGIDSVMLVMIHIAAPATMVLVLGNVYEDQFLHWVRWRGFFGLIALMLYILFHVLQETPYL